MQAREFFDSLKSNDINFFCGVPDSLLKNFCAYITDNVPADRHIINANEGNSIAMACGHYLATGNPALVYLQNSGLGNCVNPLLSLADEEVYNIPTLMLIGWRGEPEVKDEPQHVKQGKVTEGLLSTMGIEYAVLPKEAEAAHKAVKKACKYMKETKKTFAFLVRKNSFESYTLANKKQNDFTLTREKAIEIAAAKLSENDIIVATTGHISREIYEYRKREKQSHKSDFLTVGAMGHSSTIAAGIALEKTNRNVFCFDGDGAFLMHMGGLPVISSMQLDNFKHFVFNNEAHDSVGGQPTSAGQLNFTEMVTSCGYSKAYSVTNQEDLEKILPEFIQINGPALLEIKVKCGARSDLGRPKEHPQENKDSFMCFTSENKSYVYKGALENISQIADKEEANNILVFCGKKSFIDNGLEEKISSSLQGKKITYYSDFENNPQATDLSRALEKTAGNYDMIVAIGGGSVMDFAKLYRFSSDNNTDLENYFSNPITNIKKETPLLAIPTTSGSGSEATKFAVVYIDGKKFSLDHQAVLPDYAIVDSALVESNPKYLKSCCGLDAFCQAIESYWSVNSTKESLEYASKAIKLCHKYLEAYVNNTTAENAEKIMQAAHYAGKAINISKTTAAHALSYTITSDYGVPHGHAVALSIGSLTVLNSQTNSDNNQDPRGENYVQGKLEEISQILNTKNFQSYFDNLLASLNIENSLDKLPILELERIVDSVNLDRLKNNPRKLTKEDLMQILKKEVV